MKKILIILFACLSLQPIFAQRSEIGFMLGTSFYLGDLNPTGIFKQSQFAGGFVYRYNFTPRWALKANVYFGNVQGSDAKTNKHYERNLSFKSPITEISAQVELNFLRLYNVPSKNHFAPYIFAGISLFSFNPRAELDGRYYDLQHLGTEGQGLDGQKKFYSLCNAAIPFGIGIKVNIAKFMCIGVEWGMRYTFTDYLDDVSGTYYDNGMLEDARGQFVARLADRSEVLHEAGSGRGNSTTKDLYSFAGATITFKIGNEDRSCDIRYNARKKVQHRLGKKN